MGRRLLAVCLLALCLGGTATAAVLRGATDPLEPQEWWLADVGAVPAAAPPAGVPITIIDSATGSILATTNLGQFSAVGPIAKVGDHLWVSTLKGRLGS